MTVKRTKTIMLWLLRCEYIVGPAKLTREGKKPFTVPEWRWLMTARTRIFNSWRKDVLEVMEEISNQSKFEEEQRKTVAALNKTDLSYQRQPQLN